MPSPGNARRQTKVLTGNLGLKQGNSQERRLSLNSDLLTVGKQKGTLNKIRGRSSDVSGKYLLSPKAHHNDSKESSKDEVDATFGEKISRGRENVPRSSLYKAAIALNQNEIPPANLRGASIAENEADGDTSSYLQMMNIEVKTSMPSKDAHLFQTGYFENSNLDTLPKEKQDGQQEDEDI